MPPNADKRTRLRVDHDPADFHEWYLTKESVLLDALGRDHRGSWTWLVVRCNNCDCRGEAVVRSDLVTDIVTERYALPNPSTGTPEC